MTIFADEMDLETETWTITFSDETTSTCLGGEGDASSFNPTISYNTPLILPPHWGIICIFAKKKPNEKMRQYIKKYLLLLVSLLISIVANAYDFEVGGIYFNKDGNCAIVTSGDSKYSGDVSIPSTVNYGGMEYSVTTIGSSAFQECTGLTSVTIPNSVTSIGYWAFYRCSGLTSVTIPNSVTSIGYGAFEYCRGLTSVTIPNSVMSIGNWAFSYCSGLTSVTIGNSVTSIGGYAFYGCSGLTSVTIPNSVTSIGDHAFSGCRGLTSVTIPNSVKGIGLGAFESCSGLTSIKVESGNTTYDSRNGCNAIIKTASNMLVSGCKNTVIPNSVTSIGDYAFSGCSGLTSVTIPNSVKGIGLGAFESCSGLISIKVESGNTTYDSRNDCNAIIETASNTLVAGCKNTVIPNSVTSIGNYAFGGCIGLTSVTIPNSVTRIGSHAFDSCSGLTSVTIPNSVTSIGYGAFRYCRGLTSVTIPNSVTSIGVYAFYGCSGLISVTIPNSVTSIGFRAFADCSNLESVISEIEIPFTIDSSVFDSDTENNGQLTVPKGKKSVYQSTEGWKEFSNIVEVISSYTLTIQSSSGGSVSYNGANISATTKTFTIDEESSVTFTITPNTGYYLSKLTVNDTDVTTSVSNNQYTISNITANTSVVATFEEIVTGIEVNATNFPDDGFRNWILSNISGADDGILTDAEIAEVKNIDCSGTNENPGNITSLQGIEFFTALTTLSCSYNRLTSLDVSNNTALKYLYCSFNQLTSLNVSGNSVLTHLSCQSNQLTSLEVSKNTALKDLSCFSNQLTYLDVSKNTALTVLSCFSNQLTSLDVSKNTALTYLTCSENQLESLDVSKNTAMTTLYCSSNQLTSLDVSNNTALTQLACSGNKLASLDVSQNTALTELYCGSNQLASLDVTKNTSLTKLNCTWNQLTSLDLSKNASINDASIGKQTTSLKAVNTSAGIAIPMPSDFDFTKVSNLKLDGTSVSGSLTTVNGQKYLVFAQAGTAQSSIDGKKLTYQYNTGNSFSSAASMDVTVSLSYDAPETYALSIQSGSGGSVSYDGTTITNTTKSFTVVEGTSATISISPNSGYKLSKLTVNGTNVTSSVSNNLYTIDNITTNTTVVATFEEIPVTTFSLSIQSGSGGSVSYDGTTITNTTRSFTVAEGTSATITISPNSGYRLSRLTVNGTNVTSSVSNNKYTINSITANTTVVATFEQIPATTYSLSIQSGAGGSVSYDGTTITNKTQSFTVNEGASATITITPNTGYKLSKLTVNGTNVTTGVKDNKYMINSISANTTVVATFEQITYTLSVQATGNGTVTYNSTATKNTTRSFTVNHGASATFTISADNGYRLASLTVNGTNVTSNVSNNHYTITNITANITVVATFEQIPATTYSLSIQSGAGGSVSYDGTTITNKTQSFTIAEGSSVTIEMAPNSGYKLESLTVNGTDVTSGVENHQYTISNITANTTVVVTFKAIPQNISLDGINYELRSATDFSLNVGRGDYSGHVVIPATVSYDGDTWTVAGVVDGAFNLSAITAITWNPNTAIGNGAFGAQTNPNLLLYVKSEAYAPTNVQNVIANGRARKIVLTDAASGNDFNCPEAFTAEEISYTHRYGMTTGIGECRGWETIALPFDVKQFTHESKGTLIPFKVFSSTSAGKPFWLYRLTASGWQEAANIEANTPYIISLPNNKVYDNDYNLPGVMTFSSSNVTVPVTEAVRSTYGERTFVANFTSQASSWSIYALNVNNDYSTYSDYLPEGSTFIRELRTVHPFEAYMMNSSGNAKQFFPLFETLPTAIREIPMQAMRGMKGVRIYSMSGELIMFDQNISIEEALKQLKRGVYFVNGKKMVVK